MDITNTMKLTSNLTEDEVFCGLLYTIIKRNSYYDNLRKYAQSYEGGMEQLVLDLRKQYDYCELSPYTFLNKFEEELENNSFIWNVDIETMSDSLDFSPDSL